MRVLIRNLSLSLLVLGAAFQCLAGDEAGWKQFGAEFTLTDSQPASQLLADPAAYVGKPVRVHGRVADVCRNKGCWMVLTEGQSSVRVTMKDYGFFVDREGAGAEAELEGTLVEKPADPEAEAHYAAESTRPETAPKPEGGSTFEFVATGVRLRKQV